MVLATIVHDVLIDLVREHQDVPIADYRRESIQVRCRRRRTAGVVRRVDDDQAGARRDARRDARPVVSERGRQQRDMHTTPARQPHRRVIGVVRRIKDNHFVTGAHHGLDG